ncbi:MAG: Holliday junction branch migration protein RuvA [Deltaproteobacteria bacterium]|nr:Holliday junction branch migration protein RuvA [Deltaproteobacteria bacterium]
MIALVKGRLARKDPSGTIVIDSGTVGYRLFVSLNTLMTLPPQGDDVSLNTITVVRDDAIHLYGFAEMDEMELFKLLVQAKGVGPRLALAILGGLKAPELAKAISSEDAGWICTVPGVGRKTAERIILELKDKVQSVEVTPGAAVPGRDDAITSDVISALANLGYKAKDGRAALKSVLKDQGEMPSFNDLIRECLSVLSGRKPSA